MTTKDAIKRIDSFIQQGNFPNILIYGMSIQSKITIYNHIINSLYPTQEEKNKYLLYINCISTKGIKNIKERIKLFSMQVANHRDKYGFKTIVLDYCDNLTYDSQYSLRRTIEQFNHNTRFVSFCKSKKNILNPIISRFVHIYVQPPSYRLKCKISQKNEELLNGFILKYNNIVENSDFTEETITHEIFQLSKLIYSYGFFALELIDKFKEHKNYIQVKMIAPIYFKNLRSEELSIFFVLNIFRNNHDFEIFDLY